MKILKAIKGNWKTTVLAILAALTVIITQVGNLTDNDPETVFDMHTLWTTGIVVLIGLFAKDGDKKSTDLDI